MTTLNTADPMPYLLAHSKRAQYLSRMAVAQLSAIYLAVLGNTLIYTGPMSHDELVNAIIEIEFPEVAAARDAYARSIAEA